MSAYLPIWRSQDHTGSGNLACVKGEPDSTPPWWPHGDAPFWQEVECPGCSRQLTVRTSDPVTIEWDRRFDGGCIGWAIHASGAVLTEFFWVVVDYDESQGPSANNTGGWSHDPTPANQFGETAFDVHECERGGESDDRAALPRDPPARTSSATADPRAP
jgi:hypothetical protein